MPNLKEVLFTINNLQYTNYFCRLKKILGDTYAFTIYNLQFTNYFCQLKKIMGDTYAIYAFKIYNLQFTNYSCQLKNKCWWYLGIYNLQNIKNNGSLH